jgi:hypothetical protein
VKFLFQEPAERATALGESGPRQAPRDFLQMSGSTLPKTDRRHEAAYRSEYGMHSVRAPQFCVGRPRLAFEAVPARPVIRF